MNVADVMTPREDLVTVSLPGTREDALAYLQEQEFSSVAVVKESNDGEEADSENGSESEQFRGLVTRESLIARPDEDQLAILAEEPPAIASGATIEELADLMVESGTRRVPVVDKVLLGIVTVTDVIRAMAEGDLAGDTAVGDLVRDQIHTLYRGTPLPVAERQLAHAGVPYGVVLDDDAEMCGVLTEVDILAVARIVEGETDTGEAVANQDDEWMWEGIKAVGNRYMPTRNVEIPAEPVGDFMSSDTITLTRTKTATEAAQRMIGSGIEQIPLVSGGELAGIIRDIDVLGALR
ncbi:signal transduction protein [Halobacteriales archaeon QS_3_64_16]|nr:MAG: signal transduction protein [Halobacteriales archaeon QS_3_64_16]